MTTPCEQPPPDYCRPERAERADAERLRRAIVHARSLYPGPVGDLIYQELRTWEDFGYRFGRGTLVYRLVDHLNEMVDQDQEKTAPAQ